MREVTICGVQLPVTNNVADNTSRLVRAIGQAARRKADFLLTPEGSLSGYRADFDRLELAAALKTVVAAAAEANIGLALGTCFKELRGGKETCRNEVRIYSPRGQFLGRHAKILRCSSVHRPGSGEIADYATSPLRTFNWQGLRFGAVICNDMWATPGYTTVPNTHLAWRLKRMGAKFILHAINSGADQRYRSYHESNLALIANALGLPIIAANAAQERGLSVNCRSGMMGVDGKWRVTVPARGEHMFMCRIRV